MSIVLHIIGVILLLLLSFSLGVLVTRTDKNIEELSKTNDELEEYLNETNSDDLDTVNLIIHEDKKIH